MHVRGLAHLHPRDAHQHADPGNQYANPYPFAYGHRHTHRHQHPNDYGYADDHFHGNEHHDPNDHLHGNEHHDPHHHRNADDHEHFHNHRYADNNGNTDPFTDPHTEPNAQPLAFPNGHSGAHGFTLSVRIAFDDRIGFGHPESIANPEPDEPTNTKSNRFKYPTYCYSLADAYLSGNGVCSNLYSLYPIQSNLGSYKNANE